MLTIKVEINGKTIYEYSAKNIGQGDYQYADYRIIDNLDGSVAGYIRSFDRSKGAKVLAEEILKLAPKPPETLFGIPVVINEFMPPNMKPLVFGKPKRRD